MEGQKAMLGTIIRYTLFVISNEIPKSHVKNDYGVHIVLFT